MRLARHLLANRYALEIGVRYLRSKKRSAVSAITLIAVTGVALGVAALLSVMSIAAGFQDEFRTKVLGVNAHVLVLKYGLDFREYRDVLQKALAIPGVVGAAPFEIDEMMLAKGARLSGVLVKGIDPERMPSVLDLPRQITQGSLEHLRRPGAHPPQDDPGTPRDPSTPTSEAAPPDRLPQVDVPTPEEIARALAAADRDSGLPSDELEARALSDANQDGLAPQTERLPGLVVGITLARNLGLRIGDRVQLVSPLAGLDASLLRTPRPNAGPPNREFEVIAIFEAGFQEYDTRLVYTDLYEAQALASRGDTVTGVEMRLADLERASEVSKTLERALGTGPYHTLDWQELNHNLFRALEIQKWMLSLVIAVIIFVAAFTVVATLIMVVLEKKREIAILKAMGAKDGAVLLMFMLQGMVVGLVGTAIGLFVGSVVCGYLTFVRFPLDPKVYLIDHLPIHATPTEFILTVVIALIICATATWIPSFWAARLLPADGVRYQ